LLDVREYIDTAGRSPFAKWLHALNVQAAAKVATALERIADGPVIASTSDGTVNGLSIRERAQQEPQFGKALLREAIELMLSGDEKTGRTILRNYINATVGLRRLEEATPIPASSLMRMFGPNGNPSAKNLFGVLAHLQAQEGVNFEIRPRRS
jgi:hypothetical protein